MSNPTDIQWTDERIEQLRADWDEGLTCGAIGRKRGWSKNAIVGKVRRLGLPNRPSPIIRNGEPARPYARRHETRPKPLPLPSLVTLAMPLPVIEAPLPEPKEEEMVRKPVVAKPPASRVACAWPTNDGVLPNGKKGWTFCEDKALLGRPYCAAHTRMATGGNKYREDAA